MFLGERTQEFCTVYNMVRLADYLFCFTGAHEYLDYIENNLYNGFLAQQNKYTGMPAYFLPMKAGSVKNGAAKQRISGAVTVQPYRLTPYIPSFAGMRTKSRTV